MTEQIKIIVNGALGRVAQEVAKAVASEPGMKLVGATELTVNEAVLTIPGQKEKVPFSADLAGLIRTTKPDVLVDFTNAANSIASARIALRNRVAMVIGSTGLTKENVEEIEKLCEENKVGAIESANFSLGTLLMMHLATIAAQYFDYCDIVETHWDNKKDAPSATSLAMARSMLKARGKPFICPKTERVVLENTRGGHMDGITIHSVRSPGFAYSGHEVILSHKGQNFTLRDETIGPESYMRGVMIAIREVLKNHKLIHGWAPWTFPSVST